MNPKERKIEFAARKFAETLIAQAVEIEPQISNDIKDIAEKISAELVGFENKIKRVESLTTKLVGKIEADLTNLLITDFSEDKAIKKSVKLRAKQNNDTLRYTFLLESETYVFNFRQTLNHLKNLDYRVPEKRIWNAWKNIGTVFDNGYRGINITVISSQRRKFELQFHTRESFDLKTETHKLYKQIKSNATSSETKSRIKKELVKTAGEIQIPQGVKKL